MLGRGSGALFRISESKPEDGRQDGESDQATDEEVSEPNAETFQFRLNLLVTCKQHRGYDGTGHLEANEIPGRTIHMG